MRLINADVVNLWIPVVVSIETEQELTDLIDSVNFIYENCDDNTREEDSRYKKLLEFLKGLRQ